MPSHMQVSDRQSEQFMVVLFILRDVMVVSLNLIAKKLACGSIILRYCGFSAFWELSKLYPQMTASSVPIGKQLVLYLLYTNLL